MVKSMFGLLIENNMLHPLTRCCRVKANEGKASDSPILTKTLSVYSYRFLEKLSSTHHQPCSLTDSFIPFKTTAKRIGFYSGNFTVRVSGLSLSRILLSLRVLLSVDMTMPPCEQKAAKRLSLNRFGLFSSSRYSMAVLGLKGDQNLIC
ncbi:hypothetical protein KWG64_04705 [Rahnella sp. PD12R]|uniref:hypothetical protein n=1 Tax=Rahnella sp. PD12R TaxID=2855688 RepID=UPI001C496E04|nr:hypothetical protein [Rahnella sp. PD12R]MBV6817241.1 hypothetical protein [Rahnella sp. PD12R]